MNEELTTKELQAFNITDVAIAELKTQYMALSLKDENDVEGFEKVHTAKMDMVHRRTSVEDVRKELKAESLEYGRKVDAEAKRITGLMKPIEDHLVSEEKKRTDAIARKKAEAEAKEAARLQERIQTLIALGCNFDGQNYFYGELKAPVAIIKVADDEQFGVLFGKIHESAFEDAKKKAEEEAVRKAEAERIAKIQAEQEAEARRLEEVARKQAEDTARIKAEQEAAEKAIREQKEALEKEKERLVEEEAARIAAIDREKKRVEDEKRRAEELEKARKEAAEKALKDAEEKAKRDSEAKAEAERQAKIKEEKRLARQPDKEKLIRLAGMVEGIAEPEMKTEEGASVLCTFKNELHEAIMHLRGNCEAL